MSRKPSEADKAWEDAISRGDMAWLKDTTFLSADYFQPPSNYQPHGWKRIAVPPATSSHVREHIYKRVPGRLVDTKYNIVAAELDSQGFDQRKRAKTTDYKSVWGWPNFDPRYQEAAMTIKQEIAKARDQVRTAYKQIAKDNQTLRKNARPTKPSRYDLSRLTFAPRKRYNTRWPITPPTWEKMIAECQPLIVFEINSVDNIAEPSFWEQFAADTRMELRQIKRSKRWWRRRMLVQSTPLTPISEELKEPSGVSAKYRPTYKAPAKRWAAAADKYFTMSASSAGVARDDAEGDKPSIEITNHRGHFRVPSSPLSSRSSAATTPAKPNAQDPDDVTNERGCFRVPSSPVSSRSSTTTASDRKRKAQDEHIEQPAADPATVAVFDQPTPQVYAEPEHETKRRVSLDNARRSDRQPQMTVIKKVGRWVTATFSGSRRSFSEAFEEQEGQDESPRTKRRHTLDVDVGRNPDIFGQTAGQHQELSPNINAKPRTKSAKLLNGKATFTAEWDTLSDVPSEFSMARKALDPEAAFTPKTSTILPAYRKAFIDWDAIPNIDDQIRDLLDRKADQAFGKVDDDYKVDDSDKTADDDKVDDGDSVGSDETNPFDESVYQRIQSVLQPDEDEDMTVGDLEVDTTPPNPPATAPLMADSPVDRSPSHDSIVPGSPTPDLPAAMETTVETAYTIHDPDVPLPSVEHDVETTTVESTVMIDTPSSGELAATPQPAGLSAGDSHAAIGQQLDAATADEPLPDVHPVEQLPMPSQPDEPAEGQPDEGVASDPTGQPQAEEAHDGDDNSFLHNWVRHVKDIKKAVLSFGSPKAPAGAPAPPSDSTSPSEPKPLSDSKSPSDSKTLSDYKPPSDSKLSSELFAAPKSPRKVLAQKDTNMSPIASKTSMTGSPGKKRKLKEVEGAPLNLKKTSGLEDPDLEDTNPQPLRKRRRKGAEMDAPDGIFNPEMSSHSLTQRGFSGGPRRSKRVAAPRPTAPTAPATISVRLPGSGDLDMPKVSTEALMQAKKERELATLTRTNTRRNKGGALPVSAVLTGQQQPAVSADPFVSAEQASAPRANKPAKVVRWAPDLVHYQGDDDSASSASTIAAEAPWEGSPLAAAPTVAEQPSGPDASAAASPLLPHLVPDTPPASIFASAPPESEKKKALRPRPSRLPAPASVTKATTPARKTPTHARRSQSAAAATPSRITPASARRSSSVGGARLGTPAAKRRGSAKK